MKLPPEARAELEAHELKTRGRRVKKIPKTAVLVQAIERKGVERGTSRPLLTLKGLK